MKLFVTTHPAAQQPAPTLVCLHGWGMNRLIWQPLQPHLTQYFNLLCVDLPGHGNSDWQPGPPSVALVQHWAHAILAILPPVSVILLGWSLGALLAWELVRQVPQRITAWIAVAASPCFVQRPDWPLALPHSALEQLAQDLQHQSQQALRQFLFWQCQTDPKRKAILRQCQPLIDSPLPSTATLQEGLALLRDTDYRPHLPTLRPGTLILGEQDPLVPLGIGPQITHLAPHWRLEIMATAGHLPFLSNPAAFMNILQKAVL